jgi:ketosteroid isomerase-like protein
MGEAENKQVVEELWRLLEKQDWDGAGALLHDDFVQEWPQSKERIRGRENCMAINRNYPGFPSQSMGRVLAAGDLVTSEVVLDYGGQTYHGISLFEFRDGKIVRETDYFAQPFDAPAWRAQWVERMP